MIRGVVKPRGFSNPWPLSEVMRLLLPRRVVVMSCFRSNARYSQSQSLTLQNRQIWKALCPVAQPGFRDLGYCPGVRAQISLLLQQTAPQDVALQVV